MHILATVTFEVGSQLVNIGYDIFGSSFKLSSVIAVVTNTTLYNATYGETSEDYCRAYFLRNNCSEVYVLKSIVDDLNNSNTYLNNTDYFTKENGTGDYSSYYHYTKIGSINIGAEP